MCIYDSPGQKVSREKCAGFSSFTEPVASQAQEYIKTNHSHMSVVKAFVTLTICLRKDPTFRTCGNVAVSPAPFVVGCVLTLEEPVSLSILPSEQPDLFVITTCAPLINEGHKGAETMLCTSLPTGPELGCPTGK